MTTVKQLYDAMNRLAPFSLAEKGDNVGLLSGEMSAPVKKVLLALDISNYVAAEAAEKGADLVISHHPVIYHPLYTLKAENPACRLLKSGIAAICAHTNLDIARGGVNDILQQALGFPEGELIEVAKVLPYKQVVVFVPESHVEAVYEAMGSAGAGTLGNYTGCAFSSAGEGRFVPNTKASSFIGSAGETEKVREIRLEMLASPERLGAVLCAMKAAHPYEEPAFQVLDNHALREEYGFGRLCTLEQEILPKALAHRIKEALGCTLVRYVDTGRPLKRVAFCSGGAGSLLPDALRLGADAYISGDIKHDQWITAQNEGVALFDAGHYHTERIVLPMLKKALSKEFSEVCFEIAASDTDPVSYEF